MRVTRSRRPARVAALQAVYAVVIGGRALDEALKESCSHGELSDDLRDYAHHLSNLMLAHREEYDERVGRHLAAGWSPIRLVATDRILLWLACAELDSSPDVPPKVTAAEVSALARNYGDKESGNYVQAVVGKLVAESPKRDWVPQAREEPMPEPATEETLSDEPLDEDPDSDKVGPWVIRTEG